MNELFLRLIIFAIAYKLIEDSIEIKIRCTRNANSDNTSIFRFLLVLIIVFYDLYPEILRAMWDIVAEILSTGL